jgi:hypothetical protein
LPIGRSEDVPVCTVAVERLPAASLAGGGYELWISGRGTVALPSSGELAVEVAEPVVVLGFKARGYRGEVREYKVYPGENVIRVSLQRLE